jgi:hypothetical protein
VIFKITSDEGPNAVMMGAFFDPVSTGGATLVPVGVTGNGAFQLKVNGQPGAAYAVQASVDNKTWLHIGTVNLTTNTAVFNDTSATWKTASFYRAISTK